MASGHAIRQRHIKNDYKITTQIKDVSPVRLVCNEFHSIKFNLFLKKANIKTNLPSPQQSTSQSNELHLQKLIMWICFTKAKVRSVTQR